MKRKLNEIWKEKYGSRIVYRLQCPGGIMTFNTKKKALEVQKIFGNKLTKEMN